MNRGKFIVIEGAAGSGKSTQLGLLQDRLTKNGTKFEPLKFPRYEHPAGYFLKSYLNGAYGEVYDVGAEKASVFFALDRFDARNDIEKVITSGAHIVSDRYTGSNLGYQGAKIENDKKRREYYQWLYDFEFGLLGVVRPDLNIFLHVPAEISFELVKKRAEEGGAGLDAQEQSVDRFRWNEKVYLELTELFPDDFIRIDCAPNGALLSIDEVHEILWAKVAEVLAKQ